MQMSGDRRQAAQTEAGAAAGVTLCARPPVERGFIPPGRAAPAASCRGPAGAGRGPPAWRDGGRDRHAPGCGPACGGACARPSPPGRPGAARCPAAGRRGARP
ncbi:MAG: hypothetical protein EPO12_13000, partial [Aquabacterium sp.]